MTLTARFETGGGNIPIVLESNQNHARAEDTEICPTLPASMRLGGGYIPMIVDALPFDTTQITSDKNWSHPKYGDPCHPLAMNQHPPTVVIEKEDEVAMTALSTHKQYFHTEAQIEQCASLIASDYKDPPTVTLVDGSEEMEESKSVVRRLTPDECASLQGFPRNWCNIGDWTDSKGKIHKDADSPKYKAYGNSIAVGFDNRRSGFWCWMARRICAQYERQITMGSLFDGIGGFPLAFQSCGAIPVWASEIEEFPIAVTKKHFPEGET